MKLTESAIRALEHWAEHYNHEIEVLAKEKENAVLQGRMFRSYLKRKKEKEKSKQGDRISEASSGR